MADQPQRTEEQPVLRIEPDWPQPGWPDTHALKLSITPGWADHLVELLESHSLRYSKVVYASGGPGLAIYVVYPVLATTVALGGFKGLAAVLDALFHRHDGKRFHVVIGDDEYSAEGVSVDKAERFIKQVLDQRAGLDRQRAERRNQLQDGGQAGAQAE